MVENEIAVANKSKRPIMINVLSIENAVVLDIYLITCVLKNSVVKVLPWWFL